MPTHNTRDPATGRTWRVMASHLCCVWRSRYKNRSFCSPSHKPSIHSLMASP